MSKPKFRVTQQIYVARYVNGSPYTKGEQVTIVAVNNTGTRRQPEYRYRVARAYYYEEDLSEVNPLD